MATEKKIDWVIDHKFDPVRCRHTMNGLVSVLHCHHYSSLYCQLADDAKLVDGKKLLVRSAELAFHKMLSNYYKEHDVTSVDDRIELAQEYWRLVGMGLLKFERIGEMSAAARMDRSHVDEGWIKKWKKRDEPVNFFGQGYLAAAMAAIYDLPPGAFVVHETQSIVSGADCSRFKVVRA